MTLDIVIPTIGAQELLDETIKLYKQTTVTKPNIIVIDNGSSPPINNATVHNSDNLGMIQTLIQAKSLSNADLLMYTHVDMQFYEHGWDKKVTDVFEQNPKIGLLGVVGGIMADTNSGRGSEILVFSSIQNTSGKFEGIPTPIDSAFQYVILLDGCCMIFRREALNKIIIDEKYLPHHFYDKEWCLQMIMAGYNNAVFPVKCAHLGGRVANQEAFQTWATKKINSLQSISGDQYFYNYNKQLYLNNWIPILPVLILGDHIFTNKGTLRKL
jgi:GT2 family glycosyltransferase